MTSIVASVTRRSITRAALLGVCVCVARPVWAQDVEPLALQERECSIDLRLPGQMSDILSNVLMRIAKKQHAEVQAFLANAEQRYATGDDLLRAAAGRFGIDAQRLAAEVIRMKHVNCSHGEILGADGEVIEAGPPDDASDPAAPVDLSTFARNVALHVVLHELGHALVREFDLPILSNEETMADAFATHFLTTHLPDRAPDILAARVNSLLIEAGEVPRDQWPVRGEHDCDARRAYQIAALAVASDPVKYAGVAAAAGLSKEDIRDATDYGAEIHRSWRRTLAPLMMPAGTRSGEARVRSDPDGFAGEHAEGLLAELHSIAGRFDWHSQVTIHFAAGDGGASWNRGRRTITVNTHYLRRFVEQGRTLDLLERPNR